MRSQKQKANRMIQKTRPYDRDDHDRVIIPITVTDDTDFLSVFAENNTPVISSEVADYLETKTADLSAKESLHLRIFSDCIDETEQVLYPAAIREYYCKQFIKHRREVRRNFILAAVLALVGLALLAATSLVDHWFGLPVWTEALDVVAWVFLWEAVDVLVFRNYEAQMECRRCHNTIHMELEFLPMSSLAKAGLSAE